MAGTGATIDSRAFEAALREKMARLTRSADNQAKRLAEDTANRERELVAVETGETRDSIRVVKASEGNYEIHIGGAGVYLEFGTSDMAAEPFARPAIAEAPARFHPPSY